MKRRVLSFILALTLCLNLCPVQVLAADEGTDASLCRHHPTHTDECGYIPGSPGEPCTFVCQICPIEDLIGKLPDSVSAGNSEQVQAQLSEIYALYDGLASDEQQQVDLSSCVSLQNQLDELVAAVQSNVLSRGVLLYLLDKDDSYTSPYEVSTPLQIDTNEYTLTGLSSNAIRVVGTGKLYLTGTVISKKGAGVEVQSGGFLSITEPGTVITGTTYALDIASNAEVHLSAGTYTGTSAAIRTGDGDFAALLEPGYTYFDASGNPVPPENLASAKTLVVKQCTDHASRTYAPNAGAPTHTWTCDVCGTTGTEPCTFTFDTDGKGICDLCNNEITVAVDRESLKVLAYDEGVKPANGTVHVTAKDGTPLIQDTDYTVSYSTHADVGSTDVTVTVTVAVGAGNGTFTKEYTFTQNDLPVLEWDTTDVVVPVSVPYDGAPVESGDLPPVRIHISSPSVDLQQYLQYSYRAQGQGDAPYTDGLPTNAGTYDVVVSLPEKPVDVPDYQAASSDPITLVIEKINPIDTAPAATQPVFNGAAQALATAGTLNPAAARDGAEIKFATSEAGPYSTDIPTGTDAGTDYHVWYKVDGGDNYDAVSPMEINGVEIQRKQITPIVTLSDYTYQYDGGWKEPKVTVKDEDDVTYLLDTEYQVDYVNNQNVSTDGNPAKVIVTDKAGGNYAVDRVEVEFKITLREQETLSITNKPNTVAYGDEFTLSTLGGSGNGNITWKIVANPGDDGSATVNPTSGRVKITGAGTITVKATKSGVDPETNIRNYDDATAIWTFEADKKSVVATVTAEDRDYNGSNVATIHAVVEQGVLSGDEITIDGLTGTFSDENAGANKTVTVVADPSKVTISGTNSQHYDVSYSSLTVTATINKAIVSITTNPIPATLTYDGNPQALIGTGAVVGTTGVNVEYALNENGPYSTTIPKETDADTYTVWYRVQETTNYTGLAPASVTAIINKKTVSPTITLSGDGLTVETNSTYSYIYDGNAKTPDVTLKEADGTPISADEYTVAYSDNTNAGTATVTVTAKDDGNYSFTSGPVTENFTIKQEQAQVITAPDMAGDPLTYTTRAQRLVTQGDGYGGRMVYSLDDTDMDGTGTYSADIPTKTDAGDYTVYYKVEGDPNHSDSDVGSVTVTIAPKTVKDPTIVLLDDKGDTLVSYTYDGSPKTPAVVVMDGSTVIGTTDDTTGENDEYNIVYRSNVDAGDATVSITDKQGGNYTVTGSTTFVILKADIKFDTDPADAGATYDGKAHELLVPGETSGGEVLYALGSATGTYTAAIPTATEAGQYTVYYKVVGDKNHNDFAVKSVPATIGRKPLTDITIELTPDGFVYDGNVKLPTVTVKDGETVLPKGEYTWVCDTPSPTNEGTYTITIRDAAGGNYDLSKLVSPANQAAFTIGKAAQAELVIESKPSSTVYGSTFTLTTSGGSSATPVTWAVEGPATVNDNGDVEITGVGEVTIKATNPGDQNYLPVSAQWTFTAAPKPVTASVTVLDKDYDGTADATVGSAGITTINNDKVTIDPNSITAAFVTSTVGAGKTVTLDTRNVEVDGQDAEKYVISYPDKVTAEIKQATTRITAPDKIDPLTYTGQAQALVTAGETNVGFIVYSLEEDGTYSPEIPTGTDAGDYTVYYKVDATANYTGAAGGPIAVTIAPKAISATVELSKSSYVYDSAKQEPSITVKDGRTVLDEDQYTVTWAGDKNQTDDELLTIVGVYTATIQNVTNGNYTFSQTATVEIVPAPQDALSITGQPDHVYYGDTVKTLKTTGGSGNGTVKWMLSDETYSTINQATGELSVKDTGTLTVTAERTVPNYGTVTDTWTFTVEPKPVIAEVTVTAKDFDGTNSVAPADIKAEVKTSDLVDPDNDSIAISNLTGTYDNANAGTGKTVTLDDSKVKITGDTGKYAVSCPATVKADINPKAVTISVTLSGNDLQTDNSSTPPAYSYEYDGTEKTPTVTVTADDDDNTVLKASDYTVSYADNKNAGTAAVTVKSAEGGNYTFEDKSVPFTIEKAAAQLTGSPKANDLTYTGQAQELVTVGTATGGHIEYALDGVDNGKAIPTATKAGTYVVSYKVVGDDNHEDGPSGSVTVTIKPKEIVSPKITVNGTYTYDGTAKKPTGTAIEVKDGATLIPDDEYDVSYRDNVDAGTATVLITNANGGNYIVNGTGTFTIAKADVEDEDVMPPEGLENLPYNGTAQALVKAGSASGGTMVYSLEEEGVYSPAIPTKTAVGNYKVWFKVQGDDNHKDTEPDSVDASIVVNNVTNPTIQVTPEKTAYNGENQKPAVIVMDDKGAVIDGSEYMVTYTDGKGATVTDLTYVDEYTLTITGVRDGNYTFDATDGKNTAKFEILKADQTPLTITGTRERVYYGDKIQLGTTGGNGAITWDVGNSTIATISADGLLEITGVGSVTVTATSEADGYADQKATWTFYADPKPVTAVVTAEARTYRDNDTTATVTATLQSSDLVGTDKIKITLSGSFEDPNAGTDKKVIVNSSAPDFDGSVGDPENYNITYPATTTASILKADIDMDDVTAPTAVEDLEYTGNPLALVKAGDVTGGTMEYSTDNITYSASLPTGTNAGDYDVWYRVKGNSNHNDTAGTKLDDPVTIDKQAVSQPTIEFTPNSVSYDGAVHKPAVTVKDKNGREIPDNEYTVAYSTTTDWTKAGNHTVTITDKGDGNYDITTASEDFIILMMGQNPLSIGNKPGRVYYGDTFRLEVTGGSGTGEVTWQSTSNATIDPSGLVTILNPGSVTITAQKAADNNYSAQTVSWTFSAEKKPVTAVVTAKNKEYDTNDTATLVVTWPANSLLNGDNIDLGSVLAGRFDDEKVGTDKTVTISGTAPTSSKYDVSWNTTTTASITPAAASVTNGTTTKLTYTGSSQDLISGVTAANGTVVYSRDGVKFTQVVPAETNAGTYTFWYKALADENYKDSPVVEETVTIEPKPVADPGIELTPDEFEYDGKAKKPDVEVKDGSTVIPPSEYTVSYSNNIVVSTDAAPAKVTISNADGGNYKITTKTANFTIKPGTAALTGVPQGKANLIYNGNPQELVTPGTAVNGQVVYSLTGNENDYSTMIPKGTNAGNYSVYYKVKGENGASDTAVHIEYVTIQPKPVNNPEIITDLEDDVVPYTGSAYRPNVLAVVMDDNTRILANEYTVTYKNNTNPGTATIIVLSKSGSNYNIYATTTFEIVKEAAKFTTEPEGKENLVYNGTAQELVTWGEAEGGDIFYSLDGVSFTGVIPTGTERKVYTVYAKVVGDSKHEDSDVMRITAEITQNVVDDPIVKLSGSSFSYTGNPITPTVIVEDDNGNTIPATEYTVRYENNTAAGDNTAKVHITSRGTNYSFTAEETFSIVSADQPPLEITGKKDAVYYGDKLYLDTTGGSGGGEVTWAVDADEGVATIDTDGTVTIKKAGRVTIKATKAADGGYKEATATWTFYANPKTVTATVTAANKTYDNSTTATFTVTFSGLLPGESISDTDYTVQGGFTDEDVGSSKDVIIIGLMFTDAAISEKYAIEYNRTTTASITPASPTVTDEPVLARSLTYNGSKQALLSDGGAATGGTIMYSLDGLSYSFNIPEGTDADTYTVWYKVVASDDNHKDTAAVKVGNVIIAQNSNPPTVLCTPGTVQYDGKEKTPTVIVRDSANRIIPEGEYSVELDRTAIAVGIYNVTVTDILGGNYEFTTPATGTFEIVRASQLPLTIKTDVPTNVYYGDTFRLSAEGGSGSGAVQWAITGSTTAATISTDGVVTVTGTGGFSVTAYRAADDDYSNSNTDTVVFEAKPKPVTPVVTAEDKRYDGTKNATLHASWKNGDLVGEDEIELTVGVGQFASEDVGTNKQVAIMGCSFTGTDADKYTITWPESTTASIIRVDAEYDDEPADPGLTYTGNPRPLVTVGTTKGGIGTVEYSTSQDGRYSTEIPTGTDAGKYTVWYRVEDSVNYMGITARPIDVVIAKAEPTISPYPTASGTAGQTLGEIGFTDTGAADTAGTFAWKNDNIEPPEGMSQQYVVFTPADTDNYEVVTFLIPVTISPAAGSNSGSSSDATTPSSPGTSSSTTTPSSPGTSTSPVTPSEPGTVQTTVQNGTASTVVSAAAGSKLVREAVENQSENIVIKPEITGEVTKTEVSLPASTVSQIKSETNAALTVSAPIADVTIPNAALDTLGSAGGTVSVAAEQVDQAVVLTLTAGGETVESVPGGVTLTVPVEDAVPGTVAVLVNEDGTRETLRKVVVEDGKLSIPLDGSATVEIVDNSKDFTDVSDTDWAADAVAFASAHELFNGTSETTFSPNRAMTRGMLATVLYSLEGNPELDLDDAFSDVSSGAWYADGIAWAAENGIVNGYGDGQFGPNNSITREQFAVMLWRYVGSPEASSQALDFDDADQVSSYALEALCWAVENGILNGFGNGLLSPGGTATRAQAAQMLKNFLENT